MKILIWIGCMAIPSITTMLIKDNGILLGGALYGVLCAILYGAAAWIANMLCAKLDWGRAMEEVKKSGMSVTEYAKQGLTQEFVDQLPKNTYEQMKVILKKKEAEGGITHAQYIILLKLCSWTPGKDQYPKI